MLEYIHTIMFVDCLFVDECCIFGSMSQYLNSAISSVIDFCFPIYYLSVSNVVIV